MSFSFSFNIPTNDQSIIEVKKVNDELNISSSALINISVQDPHILQSEFIAKPLEYSNYNDISYFDVSITNDISLKLCKSTVNDTKYDIIPHIYEGGNVLWECSMDLARFLVNSKYILKRNDRKQNEIELIELGCGHGILGLVSLALGCLNVTFSDYNREVLLSTTWKNIILNEPILPICDLRSIKCYSGDWIDLSNMLNDTFYDVIVAAEVFYSIEACHKVCFFIVKHLNVNGIALLANKRFYFGVGGGVLSFMDIFNKNISTMTKTFKIEIIQSYEDGKSNIRDIIQVIRMT